MQCVHLNGVDLEYDVQGAGEPLVLIHGSILADALLPPGPLGDFTPLFHPRP
jgi:hypothetical protein